MLSFLELIHAKKHLLFDGAIGTELYKRGIFINRCFEDANLTNQDLVYEMHHDYVKAGANILTTNSWGANRLKLREHNLDDRLRLINMRAVELARKAAQSEVYVAGSVGPLGVRIEPYGPTSFEEARAYFKEQISALIEAGVDLITLETFSDVSELSEAILASKELAPDLPVIAHVTITMEGCTPLGTPVLTVMRLLQESKADIVGLNCSVGPQPMFSCIEKLKGQIYKPLCVQPNAGLPKGVDGRQMYMSTPEYLAHFAKEFLQAGVQIVGGCCGTSPEHIRAMANAIRYTRAVQGTEKQQAAQKSVYVVSEDDKPKQKPIPFSEKSKWSRKIAQGDLVRSIELLPPSGVDPRGILEKSKLVKQAGIDVINIPDGPRASARMSAILTAVMIEQQAQIETVLHYTCRDRNLLGMQSDMLGAHAIGLRNMLLITGDPPKMGSYPNATGVFDVDSIGLTNMVHRLNQGVDLGGRSIGQLAALSIGVGVNPVHYDLDLELERFAWKVEAGAEWAITQPVFDIEALFQFLERIDKMNIKIPIIVGAWPLMSYRNALFMNNEVPGIVIPPDIMSRMEKAKDSAEALSIGIEVASNIIQKLEKNVAGFQVSAPFGRIDIALQTLG
jgi:homocysteine S-methyltransferase